jgi:UDP-N-acetylmuramate--alanine ligase
MCEEHHSDHHQDGHGHDHQEVHLDNVDAAIHSYTAHGFDADYYSQNVRNYNGNIYFDLRTPKGVIYDLELTNTALYSVENAVAAAAAVLSLGVSDQELREGLSTYKGVRRRFDYHIKTKNLVMIDDYAHHPQEIAACLESVRYLYPGKRLVVVFQPHLYSRTRDFMDEFAQILGAADELILLDIYPAREKPIEGITSAALLEKVKLGDKKCCPKSELISLIDNEKPNLLVTMGAGDIDRFVEPLEKLITTW